MTINFPKLRLSWIALAAFVGALLGSGGSSTACCTTMSSGKGCAAVRSCCETPPTDIPVKDHEQAATRVAEVRQEAPLGGCTCRSEAPAVPEPKGDRSGESRPDSRRNEVTELLDFRVISQPIHALAASTVSPSHRSPTYLLNCRFLI